MTALSLGAGALSVAVVGAHPDDIEIGCGGLLLRLAARPTTTVRTFVATGEGERADEARAAAGAFGVTDPVTLGGFRDGRLPAEWDGVKTAMHTFADDLGDVDLVLAPRPDDAHQDHSLLGSLTTTVWRGPLVLHYEIPKWDGDLGRAQVYVPLGEDDARRKVDLLNASFPSQRARHWWDDELFLGLLRIRGMECGTRWAEGYTSTKLALRI